MHDHDFHPTRLKEKSSQPDLYNITTRKLRQQAFQSERGWVSDLARAHDDADDLVQWLQELWRALVHQPPATKVCIFPCHV